jgi:aspartate kinase
MSPASLFRIFSLLASRKINVDIILQSIGRDNTKDVSFTVSEGIISRPRWQAAQRDSLAFAAARAK